jgi:outer membrane protein
MRRSIIALSRADPAAGDRSLKARPHGCLSLAALALSLAAAGAEAQNRIGFVNQDRIMRESTVAQRAQKKIEAEFAKRDQELSKIAEQLKKMQEGLERNAMTMSDSERGKREREFNDTNREFQRRQREFREDLGTRRNEELSGIINRANQVIRQIAESEKLDAVFQDGQVIWSNPRIDITERVIKALDDPKAAK